MVLKFVLLCIVAYFLGNISFARIFSHFAKTDITKQGSGNPGTMNMIRTFGFKKGILTLVFDASKGALAAFLGTLLFSANGESVSLVAMYVGGFCAVLGHIYPIMYGFKGGKGIATMLGMFFVANWVWSLIGFGACIAYLFFFDYGAVASFLMITIITYIEAGNHPDNLGVSIFLFLTYVIVWLAHRENIVRLLTGKEKKVNFKKQLAKITRKQQSKKVLKIEKKLEKASEKLENIG